MKKNDIYDHLAQVYLNGNSNARKKPAPGKLSTKPLKSFLKFSAVVITIFILVLSIIFFWQNKPSQSKDDTVIIDSQINKINIGNFNQTTKGIVAFDLRDKEIDLFSYKSLGFFARKSNYKDKILVRVELIDTLGNQSVVYIDQVPTFKWKDFEIKLKDFKELKDNWDISLLAFVVEDWKTKEDKATLYIDNVRLLK